MLLMTTYLVTIATNCCQILSKCVSRINEQLLKTVYANNKCCWRNRRKIFGGWHPPPCTPEGYQGAKKQAHNLNSYYVILDFVNVLIASRYSLLPYFKSSTRWNKDGKPIWHNMKSTERRIKHHTSRLTFHLTEIVRSRWVKISIIQCFIHNRHIFL